MRIYKSIIAGALALSVTGCTETMDRFGNVSMVELAATLGGAAAGGYVGAQFGGGFAKTAFIATGVMVGGSAGYAASRFLEQSDQAQHDSSARLALNTKPDGDVVRWQNPETGNSGIFRSVASFKSGNGQLCRQYRSSVVMKDGVFSGSGTACQQADGNWLKLHEEFS